jgi:hypothetical protein
MNLKQAAYQWGRLKNSNTHILCPVMEAALIACLGKASIDYWSEGSTRDLIFIPILAYFSYKWAGLTKMSFQSKKKINRLEKNKDSSAESMRVMIKDKQGLEMLLEKTAENKRAEWGTVLKSYKDNDRTIIYEVADPDLSEEKGLVRKISRTMMGFNLKKMKEGEYNGQHHFHRSRLISGWGGQHFAVNLMDRAMGPRDKDNINILTFNLPEGPEIICFNYKHTYIPSDKSKQELIRATPKQIMEYLS